MNSLTHRSTQDSSSDEDMERASSASSAVDMAEDANEPSDAFQDKFAEDASALRRLTRKLDKSLETVKRNDEEKGTVPVVVTADIYEGQSLKKIFRFERVFQLDVREKGQLPTDAVETLQNQSLIPLVAKGFNWTTWACLSCNSSDKTVAPWMVPGPLLSHPALGSGLTIEIFPVCSTNSHCQEAVQSLVEQHHLNLPTVFPLKEGTEIVSPCDYCGAEPDSDPDSDVFQRCGRCHVNIFCTPTCFKAAWKRDHKETCHALPKRPLGGIAETMFRMGLTIQR